MRKLRIGIIDLVAKGPTRAWFARVMHANLASIMPQVIAVWCEQAGHHITYVCYTGVENLVETLPDNIDLVFIGAFTEAAQLPYALSDLFRSRGAVTALGGPHARCYPQDAAQYFDYVLGFTDKAVIRAVWQDCVPHRPIGLHLAASQQPTTLPGVRKRWKFIALTLHKAPLIQVEPMLGSLGCPYTCSFCIDALIPYQPLDVEVIKEDLRFLLQTFKRPLVGWHDPNFGVRFNDTMDAIVDEGAEPFMLTKRFVDLTPGAFPGYSLLTAFGQAAPLNFAYQRANRILPFPFHFLNNNQAMNVTPKHYTWTDFYEHVIDLARYSFSWRAIRNRCRATSGVVPRWMKVVRAVSSEGFGRIRYHTAVLHRLNTDRQFRRYCERETTELPQFYVDIVRKDLGPLWEWLPQEALRHHPNGSLTSGVV